MGEKIQLEQKIIELKLAKRDLVLASKNTDKIDIEIKEIEKKIENIVACIK